MHPTVLAVTQRIEARSQELRAAYLESLAQLAARPRGSDRLGCANVAHAVAPLAPPDKLRIIEERAPHLAIVTAYNEMLSAHRPYADYPERLRAAAHALGATVQVAGGVPAMCDGITQGEPGMELSLFSRDVIAMGTAVALSHDVFDGALLLGVCDKIVPGLLIGALHFGHLPCLFVPAGPMASGLSNREKAAMRERAAAGEVGRAELLQSEMASYHAPGTCTFYGTANSNQMLLEAMGLHVPGAAFAPPFSGLRTALTEAAVPLLLERCRPGQKLPIGQLVDARSIVNAVVALMATGGSTNHVIHWVAVARAAGLRLTLDDFAALSDVVPLLARVYPNGAADVNAFEAAGGPAWVLRELADAGLLHADAAAMHPQGLRQHMRRPQWTADPAHASKPEAPFGGRLAWPELPQAAGDDSVLRPVTAPFATDGGLKVLDGPLGRAVIKISSVPADRHIVEGRVHVFDSQEAVQAAFEADALQGDVVVVVRFQGPQANGMPELHKLTPPLAVLQGRGQRVALVTDGRMSGASGKVPAAIHVSPEAAAGGPLARVADGDRIRIDAATGRLEWWPGDGVPLAQRAPATPTLPAGDSLGRALFGGMRRTARSAEEGAVTWL